MNTSQPLPVCKIMLLLTAEDTGVAEVQVEAGVPEDMILVLALVPVPLLAPILGLGPVHALLILVLPGKFVLTIICCALKFMLLDHCNHEILIPKVVISG